jgi:hypothetical protein
MSALLSRDVLLDWASIRKCVPSEEAFLGTVLRVDEEPDVQIVALPQPRPLTPRERELLDFLVAGPVNSPELRAQAETAEVSGVCSCGCPSIQFAVDDAAPRAHLDGPEVVATGGAEIRAVGVVEEGRETGVTLHVIGDVVNGKGVIWELEVWPTARHGDQQSVLPPINTLRFTTP